MQIGETSPAGKESTVSSATRVRREHRSLRPVVGFLTAHSPMRRLFDGSSRSLRTAIAMSLLLWSSAVPAVAEDTRWQAVDDITQCAEEYVRRAVATVDKRITPQAGRLDRRLRLPRCSQPLSPFQARGTKITSRTVVGVRCDGTDPWKIYVPVNVVVTATVLIARRALPAGHVLQSDDVGTEEHDVSRFVGGYLSEPGDVLGKRLKHSLMAGRVITPSVLKDRIMIKRGQTVTIVARGADVNISMAGTALTDGAENQRIRVENSASKRVIEGIVRTPEHVEVLVR